MNSLGVHLNRYRLPFVQPLTLGAHSYTYREGLLLKIIDYSGCYWTEIAPLPGFSRETLIEAAAQVHTLFAGGKVTHDALRQFAVRTELFPSVRCGLEMLLLKLPGSTNVDDNLVHCAQPSSVVNVNALVTGSIEDIAEQASELMRKGFRAIKLKVGGRAIDADVARVVALMELLSPAVEVRLDANRAWSLAQAEEFAGAVGGRPISYTEEPLRNPAELPILGQRTQLPLAWDETTREVPAETAIPFPNLRAVVLKPMLLGGIHATNNWITWAEKMNIRVVISAAFESGCGIGSLVEYVARIGHGDIPCGFDTLRFFERDILLSPLSIRNGAFDSAVVRKSAAQVDESQLTEVPL